ncbi:MAG: sigma-54-dependent Fis family transcriptional regulator [Spirochaetales bacterium]|nr:sigma-54-dependent Fis family transcriptional regulator [Spirochaetales bacterium]
MNHTNRILLVDDDTTALSLMQDLLKNRGFKSDTAISVEKACRMLEAEAYKVVVTDLKMPGKSGLDLLDVVVEKYPETQVIIITGHGTIRNAVDALKKGAFEYLSKPLQMDELSLVIDKAITHSRLINENTFLKTELARTKEFHYQTGSKALKDIYKTVDVIRNEDTSVLIQGESGTGKEVIARLIHDSGRRSGGSFVPINCGAIPEKLIVSELFGYEKGAFTGADRRTPGKLEVADGGTLFLDEINELPFKAQVALLRFIQERELVPLGSNRRVAVNVRVIAATNSDLGRLVSEGAFREDLYYRINVLPLYLPPLRERTDDIIPLANWFLKKIKSFSPRPAEKFSRKAEEVLKTYQWPGNIRELRNCVDRASVICREKVIDADFLFLKNPEKISTGNTFSVSEVVELKNLEELYIDWVMGKHKGNKTKSAQALGISVRGLRHKINSGQQ